MSYFILLAVCSVLVDPSQRVSRNHPLYRWLLNSSTCIGVRLLRIRVHVTGLEQIPPDCPLLFVGNHRSNFDPILTWYAFRKQNIAFISKEENFRIPLFGRIIRKCCFLPIDRHDPRKAFETICQAAELLQSGTVSVAVYPEGTRSKTGTLLPFHNGVFKIAKMAHAPIVVLAVTGTEQIHHRSPWHHTDVQLNVLAVIPPEDVSGVPTAQIGRQVSTLLQQHLQKEVLS